jgi:hypothetical protein
VIRFLLTLPYGNDEQKVYATHEGLFDTNISRLIDDTMKKSRSSDEHKAFLAREIGAITTTRLVSVLDEDKQSKLPTDSLRRLGASVRHRAVKVLRMGIDKTQLLEDGTIDQDWFSVLTQKILTDSELSTFSAQLKEYLVKPKKL